MAKKRNFSTCIIFRLSKRKKEYWKRICKKRDIALTDLIIDSVDGRISKFERRGIMAFIEKQDNIYAKIENNINQFAKIANTKKNVSENELKKFNDSLAYLADLRNKEKKIFSKILLFLSNGY